MKDEEIKLEEIEASLTLGGYIFTYRPLDGWGVCGR
jgi:hypothetical protein